ncbi:MAG: bifunctional diaminohydroxyphosphoribosylaminopyrimidine deaminase/5-amino-6-(5-phosphoribosylamino)uracil reductase RibD [Candidatus Saganbacteria bacterium]|nr:bifunctional diaminohydroxyphosphoribosylaminopyrimidine deaminase/5-amino-6-(5-phosphoribosylamino)uracil reductase RibD [Candidatus Saganbacteria bacterium]
MKFTPEDQKFMLLALGLAKKAEGTTSPDPLVGAILVKDGEVISTGYHDKVATPHAETWAIKKAGKKAKGSTLYINLEPCCHYGNNPPCTTNIINAGIKKVVAAMQDPNPLVNGQGFKILKDAGIEVKQGLFEKEAQRLNEVFLKYITTGIPFIVIKVAATLDGKIVTAKGSSHWIAGPESLKQAHHLRNVYDAILVGINTVLNDDPTLNVRLVKKVKNPIRIVLDSYGKTPINSNILNTSIAPTIMAISKQCPAKKVRAFEKKGVEVIVVPAKNGKLDLKTLFRELGKRQITSILIEGGGEVNASILETGLADKVLFFIAPKIVGGREAKTAVEGTGIAKLTDAWQIHDMSVTKTGGDLLVEGYLYQSETRLKQ